MYHNESAQRLNINLCSIPRLTPTFPRRRSLLHATRMSTEFLPLRDRDHLKTSAEVWQQCSLEALAGIEYSCKQQSGSCHNLTAGKTNPAQMPCLAIQVPRISAQSLNLLAFSVEDYLYCRTILSHAERFFKLRKGILMGDKFFSFDFPLL